jgi:hypothetical protein
MPGLQRLLLFLFAAVRYCAATLLRGSLGRRIHRRLVGANVTEQDGTVRQILLHQAGAGRGNRTSNDRVHGTHVVPAPVKVNMAVAVAVEVEAVPVRVAVPVTVVMVVVMMTVPVVMVTMPVVVTMTVVMADHVAMTAMTTTAVVMTATAVRTCIGSGRDQRRKADNGRRDESEECRTFEHSQRPLARCEPSVPLVGEPERQVQAIDFRYVFVHLTFIDRAAVWQDGGTHRIAIVRAPS